MIGALCPVFCTATHSINVNFQPVFRYYKIKDCREPPGALSPGPPSGFCPGPDEGGDSRRPQTVAVFDGDFSAISFSTIVKSPGKTHKLSWKCPGKVLEKCVQNSI